MASIDDFCVTFNGTPFQRPTERVLEHCERYFNDTFPTQLQWPDPALMAGGMQQYHLPQPPAPASPRINRFFYPYGLSRWATFWGLMTGNDLAPIITAAYASGGPKYLPFQITNSKGELVVDTVLTMLPPYKLADIELASSAFGDTLYLVTLVDERYERRSLRFTASQPSFDVPPEAATETVPSAYSGRTLAGPAGTATAGLNNQSSLTEYALYDHAAACLGMVYVRDFQPSAGLYLYRTRWRTANALAVTDRVGDRTVPTPMVAGSSPVSFDLSDTDASKQIVMPATVTVGFPTVTGTNTPGGTTADGKPSIYWVSVSPPGGLPVGQVAASVTTMQPALYATTVTGTPTNTADLSTLATQIGTDFYDSLIGACDLVYPDIPTTLNPRWACDFTIDLVNRTGDRNQTRIRRDPLNGRYAVDLLIGVDLSATSSASISYPSVRNGYGYVAGVTTTTNPVVVNDGETISGMISVDANMGINGPGYNGGTFKVTGQPWIYTPPGFTGSPFNISVDPLNGALGANAQPYGIYTNATSQIAVNSSYTQLLNYTNNTGGPIAIYPEVVAQSGTVGPTLVQWSAFAVVTARAPGSTFYP